MKNDVLGGILAGTLSEKEADEVPNRILDPSDAADAEVILGLSRVEWTAHGPECVNQFETPGLNC